jgi:hypothetical protein
VATIKALSTEELTVYVVAVAMSSSAAMTSSLTATVVTTSLAALMMMMTTTSTALTSLWMMTNYIAETTMSVATPTKVNQTLKQVVKSRSFTSLFFVDATSFSLLFAVSKKKNKKKKRKKKT